MQNCPRACCSLAARSFAFSVAVALASDDAHDGGRLVAAVKGQVQTIARSEGEATVHDSRLLHAVTRITSGARYSLIMFFGRADALEEDAEEEAAFEAFAEALPAKTRQRVLAELAALEKPVARALQAELAALDEAKSHAAPAKAAIDQARVEEAQAIEAMLRAQQQVQAARAKLAAATRNATVLRERHFGVQVRVQSLKVELAATRREARSRLMESHEHDVDDERAMASADGDAEETQVQLE